MGLVGLLSGVGRITKWGRQDVNFFFKSPGS